MIVLLNPTIFSEYFFCFGFQCSLNLYLTMFSEINTTFVNCEITVYKSTPKISRCSNIGALLLFDSKTLVLRVNILYTRLYPQPRYSVTKYRGASRFGFLLPFVLTDLLASCRYFNLPYFQPT